MPSDRIEIVSNKFRAQAEFVDGIRFASKAEGRRFSELKLLQRAGQISGLALQPQFPLVVNGIRVGRYTGDFTYVENGRDVVEDVKSSPTRTEAYQLRIKVFRACHPNIDFREVGRPERPRRRA